MLLRAAARPVAIPRLSQLQAVEGKSSYEACAKEKGGSWDHRQRADCVVDYFPEGAPVRMHCESSASDHEHASPGLLLLRRLAHSEILVLDCASVLCDVDECMAATHPFQAVSAPAVCHCRRGDRPDHVQKWALVHVRLVPGMSVVGCPLHHDESRADMTSRS